VGSIQQLDLYVAREWSGVAPRVVLPLPRCTQLDRTTRGTWLCDGVALREPGGPQVRLSASTSQRPDVAVAGNVVWVVGEGRVRRFVDTGTELELTGSLLLNQVTTLKVIQSRLATESELWVLDNQHLHRFTFTATGVLAASPAVLWNTGRRASFGLDSVLGLLVRAAADRVLVVQLVEGQLSNSLACPFRLGLNGAFAATGEPCQPVPGMPVGFEEGVLWTRVLDQGQTLHRWEVAAGKLAEQGSLVLDISVAPLGEPLRPGFIIPRLHMMSAVGPGAAAPVMSLERRTLGLELLPDTAFAGFDALSPRFYWDGDPRLNSGGTEVHERSVR
jgi:hypothetical protein